MGGGHVSTEGGNQNKESSGNVKVTIKYQGIEKEQLLINMENGLQTKNIQDTIYNFGKKCGGSERNWILMPYRQLDDFVNHYQGTIPTPSNYEKEIYAAIAKKYTVNLITLGQIIHDYSFNESKFQFSQLERENIVKCKNQLNLKKFELIKHINEIMEQDLKTINMSQIPETIKEISISDIPACSMFCPPGKAFGTGNNSKTCQPCDPSCKSCSQAGDRTKCTTCEPKFILINNQCANYKARQFKLQFISGGISIYSNGQLTPWGGNKGAKTLTVFLTDASKKVIAPYYNEPNVSFNNEKTSYEKTGYNSESKELIVESDNFYNFVKDQKIYVYNGEDLMNHSNWVTDNKGSTCIKVSANIEDKGWFELASKVCFGATRNSSGSFRIPNPF